MARHFLELYNLLLRIDLATLITVGLWVGVVPMTHTARLPVLSLLLLGMEQAQI